MSIQPSYAQSLLQVKLIRKGSMQGSKQAAELTPSEVVPEVRRKIQESKIATWATVRGALWLLMKNMMFFGFAPEDKV